MAAMRKGKDVILLPGEHDTTREYADFAREVYHLKDDQVRAPWSCRRSGEAQAAPDARATRPTH